MSLYLGENLISGSKPINLGVRNIGELVYSSLPLTDAGLHLLDGSLILGGGIYQGFVDYIAELYAENPSANYFCTEAQWQTSVTTYGSCGKFVYDSTNNTVRLPKVTGIIEGTTDLNALGDLVEESLPNITGKVGALLGDNPSGVGLKTGVFKNTRSGSTSKIKGTASALANNEVSFNASNSSSVYKDNAPVQPQTIKALLYIVVATSTKTDIQVDIDNIVTDLNGKADTDLTNITDTAKGMISEMGMPSDTYIDLTLGASGTKYTAPANGYYCLYKVSSGSNQHIQMCNVGYNNEVVTNIVIRSVSNGDYVGCTMPCAKGQQMTVNYSLGGNTIYFKFVYAIGSESEVQ